MTLFEFIAKSKRGSSIALAKTLQVSQPTVSDWCTGKKRVPVERCAAIERATNGAVTRKDLRPDDWHEIWPELAPTTPTEPAAAGV